MSNTKTWCVNAFHALTVNTDGSAKTCCMATSDIPEKKVRVYKLTELFNDTHLEKIRDDLNQGIRNSNCDRCWEEEDAGRKSKRLRDNEHYEFQDVKSLRILELNLGNTCNIKCRTCSPWNSSQWIKEKYEIEKPNVSYGSFLSRFKVLHESFDDDALMWESLEEILPNLVQMDFYGGEPFLIKKQWNIIRIAVKEGYSKNLKVHYNTNGTIWNEDQIALLSDMRIADVSISADGVGDRFEYMRNLAKWPVVHDHISKAIEWKNHNQNVVLTLCYTISILNIWYINEIIEYGDLHGINVYLNLVHSPSHYNIQNIPDDVKIKIETHLRETIPSNHSSWSWLTGIIAFMYQKSYNPIDWESFLKTTKIHDEYRNEDYKKTFSEFYNIISQHTNNLL